MASPMNVEDLESDVEFERIKQNFRSTVISTDVPAAFQDIQNELQDFISKHLSKTVTLQRTISSQFHSDSPGPKMATSSDVYGTVTPKAYQPAFRQSDADPHIIVEAVSDQAISNQGAMPSRCASANLTSTSLENHLQSLSGFLTVHVENIHALQNSLRSTTDKKPVTTVVQKPSVASSDADSKLCDAFTPQFNMLVVVSTFRAGLIVSALSLVNVLIIPGHRLAFDVGMLFAFFAIALHFGNIILAGRCAAITTRYLVADKEYEPKEFWYFLSVCEQLQSAATILFILSVGILNFLHLQFLGFSSGHNVRVCYWSVNFSLGCELEGFDRAQNFQIPCGKLLWSGRMEVMTCLSKGTQAAARAGGTREG